MVVLGARVSEFDELSRPWAWLWRRYSGRGSRPKVVACVYEKQQILWHCDRATPRLLIWCSKMFGRNQGLCSYKFVLIEKVESFILKGSYIMHNIVSNKLTIDCKGGCLVHKYQNSKENQSEIFCHFVLRNSATEFITACFWRTTLLEDNYQTLYVHVIIFQDRKTGAM